MAEHQDHHKELQLLPSPPSTESPVRKHRQTLITTDHHHHNHNRSSSMIHHDLDLKLSISLSSITTDEHPSGGGGGGVEEVKWQAAEQIRLAAIEKAYAERVRELTRREMEMAQSEFVRARVMWQKAREEVERAERLKERSMTKIDTACFEITCHSCRQRKVRTLQHDLSALFLSQEKVSSPCVDKERFDLDSIHIDKGLRDEIGLCHTRN